MTWVPVVPIGRRSLFADRRRTILGTAAVATALLLVLALDGIFAGAMRDVTRYVDTVGADVIVSQRGVRTMHMTSSSLPLASERAVAELGGIDEVAPILFASDAVTSGGDRQLAYVVGWRQGELGGPQSVASGSLPGSGEIVLDTPTAERLSAGVGDRVSVLGRTWRVSGIGGDLTNIVNSVAFVRFEDFAAATGVFRTASYLLIGTSDPAAAAARIEEETGLSASTLTAFVSEERAAIRDMSVDLLGVMSVVAFVIALVVISLLLYAATLSRLREIGVLKALGAGTGRIGGTVVAQAAWILALSLILAVGCAVALSIVLEATSAEISLSIGGAAIARIALAAITAGVLAVLVPVVRVSRLAPASVFRR
jgi:putative ABC transport system permease protein